MKGVCWGEATIGILTSGDRQIFMTPNLEWEHVDKKWEYIPGSRYGIEPVRGLEWTGGLGENGEGRKDILLREALGEAKVVLLEDQITIPDQSPFPVVQERSGIVWAIVATSAIVRLSEFQVSTIVREGFVSVSPRDVPSMRLRDRCIWERVGALVA